MTDIDTPSDAVVIERTFEVPPEVVWRMWTESEHFQSWYGPTGASIPFATMDVRVGGKRLVCMEMKTPGGDMQMWFTGEFREVITNKRLVYTDSMSDEDGNVVSPAALGMPGLPETTEVIIELTDLGGRTHMVLTHVGVSADSGGAGGWSAALDKLAARLESSAPGTPAKESNG